MFTKHTRQVSDLLLLQVQGARPKPTGPWAERAQGRMCQLPIGPACLWAKASSYEWGQPRLLHR